MPFTFACFVIGGLALSGVPPFSGFFSKDEILLVLGEQGGWNWILYVAGYVGAFMTAVYTWRMIFRAFWGEPVPEARELEQGHLHHAEAARNPADGRGGGHRRRLPRPRAPHRRAVAADAGRHGRARGAGSIVRRHRADPEDDDLAGHVPGADVRRLERRGDARRRAAGPRASCSARSLGLAGIAIAYFVWVHGPGTSARDARALPPRCTRCSSTSGTSTSSIDLRRRPPVRLVRPLRPADLRAHLRQRHARRRDDRPRPRRLGRRARRCSPASCAPTRRCCSSAPPASASTSS